jgi:hypothetical protein
MKQLINVLIAFALFGIGTTKAQNTSAASGSNATGSGGTLSYTVGQIVTTTNTGSNGTSAHGVQQPFEISVATGIKEELDITLDLVVYPNPSTDFLKLRIGDREFRNLRYQLFDINGNLLRNNKVEERETEISMNIYLPAIYFLKVTDKDKVIKTFKIIKN